MDSNLSYRERMEIGRQRRIEQLRKRIIMTCLAVTVFFLSIFAITRYAAADDSTHRTRTFASVEVKTGDTIWAIAEQYYSDEYKDINSYVNEIIRTNHLSDDRITSGAYLIVPYYMDIESNL